MSENKMPSSMTMIKDPILEPYFIGKDSNIYTDYQTVMHGTNTKGRGRKTRSKEAIKTLTFHSDIASALNSIAKMKVEERPVFNSIKEYIGAWESVRNEIKQMVNI
jgi:hypothetical protein